MGKSIQKSITQFLIRNRLKRKGVTINKYCNIYGVDFNGKATIEPFCNINGFPGTGIIIGDNFYMNYNCHILGNILIGDNVLIGPQTVIWSRDHGIHKEMLIREQDHIYQKVVIGNDVWIGANATILKGVKIGNGAVVGGGSVVTKDIPENAIVGGNPAKIIKYRD